MFEISWSELLIVAVVALIFIGPKDLPAFFNTIGRYAGVMRRQANEFRRYFEDAMREAELDQIRKEVGDIGAAVQEEVHSATAAADAGIAAATRDVESATKPVEALPASTTASTGEAPAGKTET